MAPHQAEFLSAFEDKKAKFIFTAWWDSHPCNRFEPDLNFSCRMLSSLASIFFPPVTPVILKFRFVLCFWAGQALEHGNILSDDFSSRAPDDCGHSWISPYPVSENEATAGPEPAEGISADRHRAEPSVQNAQGHLGAAELLRNMFLAECQLLGGWDSLLLLADSAF